MVLRVEPHAIPRLRQALDDALEMLSPVVQRLGWEGYLPEPWFADPVSIRTAEHYNEVVMRSEHGAYAAMLAYEAELVTMRDALAAAEERYRVTEGENAALWGRRA